MEEFEDHTEQTREQMLHQAHEATSNHEWISRVALTSALFAVFAAVTALLAGFHANEAMLDQIKGSDEWSFFQAKAIKASVLNAKIDILTALGKPKNPEDEKKAEVYKKEQEEISERAKEREKESAHHMHRHEIFARGVTMFQVAIGVAAVSILTRRRMLWWVGIAFGFAGISFLIQGFIS